MKAASALALWFGCTAAGGIAAAGDADADALRTLFGGTGVNFTTAQAQRGRGSYAENCASCHGAHLDDGQFGPALKGAVFQSHWRGQPPDALFALMMQRMPPSGPGSIGSQHYADLEALLLLENGAGASGTEFAVPGGGASESAPADAPAPRAVGGVRIDNRDADYLAAMAQRKSLLDGVTAVTDEMLRNPAASDWLMWRGTYATLGYSPLDQINKNNVGKLGVAWTLSLPASADEAAPLVHDGVLFVQSADTVEAINAVDGSVLWQYLRVLPDALHNGREARIKGMALYEDALYAATADGHIVALDVKSGTLRWDHAVVAPEFGARPGLFDGAYFHISGGPLLLRGKVIVGVSLGINTGGGDFIVGLDAHSGAQLWRFDTIARPGQPGGDSWNGAPVAQRFGSGVWTIGSYDPDLNLVYFGTGNTYDVGTLLAPRAGERVANNDALYTDSTVALDPDTGKLAWYYQHMNRDVWDLDWVFEQSLITLPVNGKPAKLLLTGGKLAIFDIIDRSNGRYAFSQDVGVQNLVAGIDAKTGKKVIAAALEPKAGRTDLICPSASGARSWPATAVDPTTSVLYVPMLDNGCMDYSWVDRAAGDVAAGGMDLRLAARPKPGNDGQFGRLEAIDLRTRRVLWSVRQRAPMASSVLVSAGGLVFSGARDRRFRAYDAKTGAELWHSIVNASPSSSPASFSIDGTQYVAVIAGGGGAFDSGSRSLTPEITDPPAGMTLWAFKLPDAGAMRP